MADCGSVHESGRIGTPPEKLPPGVVVSNASTPLLLLSPPRRHNRESLPSGEQNVFSRIIGLTMRESGTRLPRERPCAEVLAGLLTLSPIARTTVLGALAKRIGRELPVEHATTDRWRIRTEQSIQGKRDDLRIELFGAEGDVKLLWTIELKVAAGFHSSRVLGDSAAESEAGTMPPDPFGSSEEDSAVHQLLNYDHWLRMQTASHRAGFVIAIHKMALPNGLTQPWDSLTWSDIRRAIVPLLDQSLPADERLLIGQVAGFIDEYLWSREEEVMADGRIGLEHLALVRGHGSFGKETEAKVDMLVEPLVELVAGVSPTLGPVKRQKNILSGLCRSIAYGYLFGDGANVAAMFAVGIVTEGGDDVAVWFESKPSHPRKGALKEVLDAALPGLNERANGRGYRWVV